jgi:phosphoribosylanthranilate isomerase
MSKIKICGLSRAEDIEAVNLAQPDYIGFVFAESRRRVSVAIAAALKERLDARIKAVGVFVNEDIERVAEIYRSGVIDIAQLHGDENDAYIYKLKNRCGCPVIKSVGVSSFLPVLPNGADFLLFDTLSHSGSAAPLQKSVSGNSTYRGGTGRAFDWNIINDYHGQPYFLAGGLSIENIAAAVRSLNPYCADVSSGVETEGLKDAEKIYEICKLVRGLGGEPSTPA